MGGSKADMPQDSIRPPPSDYPPGPRRRTRLHRALHPGQAARPRRPRARADRRRAAALARSGARPHARNHLGAPAGARSVSHRRAPHGRPRASALRDPRRLPPWCATSGPSWSRSRPSPRPPSRASWCDSPRRLHVPTVLVTTVNVDGNRSWLEGWRRRRTLRRLAGALAASAGAATLVRRDAPALPVSVVPPQGAAVPAAPSHESHHGLTIGFVGRLVPHRGLDTLLGALAQHRHAAWRLFVAGDGPERERLERLASELRLAARVHWVGALPPEQLALRWPSWDVLVAPSRPSGKWNEPTGTTLLEAMAHEVAVIGSDTGALPELIGPAGIVTPPGDADGVGRGPGRSARSRAARRARPGGARAGDRAVQRRRGGGAHRRILAIAVQRGSP